MSDIKELKNKKKDIILTLDEDEIEAYIFALTKKYYSFLIKGDISGLENIVNSLNDIVEISEFKYGDISDYINYCLVKSSNMLFRKVFDLNCRLWTSDDKSIASNNGFNSLSYSIEKSRKRIINEECNVKELYDMILADENIDDVIVEKITGLYNAFKIFNYGGEL